MMTEAEAKARWCPFARQGNPDTNTYNRTDDGDGAKTCRCIASACMAWRFYQMDARIMRKDRRWYEGAPGPDSVGFCGLAGMPGT